MESIAPRLPVDVLVLAAHGPDLRGLREQLGERLDGHVQRLHVTCKTVGVGMGVAGASAAKRVFQLAPRVVLHLGTCGIYPDLPEYRPYDVLVADRIVLHDHAVASGRATWPDPLQLEFRTDRSLTAALSGVGQRTRAVPVASTLSVTLDQSLAADMPRRTGCHAENLEAFSIAHACHLAEVPFTCVLGATHIIGPGGKEDWRQFERQAAIAAGEVVLTWLHQGAQGLPHKS